MAQPKTATVGAEDAYEEETPTRHVSCGELVQHTAKEETEYSGAKDQENSVAPRKMMLAAHLLSRKYVQKLQILDFKKIRLRNSELNYRWRMRQHRLIITVDAHVS